MQDPSGEYSKHVQTVDDNDATSSNARLVCRTSFPPYTYLSHTYSYMSNSNATITINGMGTRTCGDLQKLADTNDLTSAQCGAVQNITLETSDPCACLNFEGSDCEPPGFTNTQKCKLCGEGHNDDDNNKRIGDVNRIIPGGILKNVRCIDAFDDNQYGMFTSVCPAVQLLVQEYCKCVSPGEDAVKQCIPMESQECNPKDDTDICCAGSCKYMNNKGGYRCTERPGDTPP